MLEILQEIANCIEIKTSKFYIYHSKYKIKKTFSNSVFFQQLSQTDQGNLISLVLSKLLLDIYFHGTVNLKNDSLINECHYELFETTSEVDWEFYECLQQSNQGKGWWNPNYQITKQEEDGTLQVKKKNTTVFIQRDRHLITEEMTAKVGDIVSVRTPKGKIIDKYYLVYGNLVSFVEEPNIFIYFNVNPKGMIILMRELTKSLNKMKVPFCFYALHNPSNYKQCDSGFLRVNRDKYQLVKPLLEYIYPTIQECFNDRIPLFTKAIAPGISLAEKPEHEFEFLEGFGANRCKIIAQALLAAHKDGEYAPDVRMDYISQFFENFEISLEHPYLNPNSQDNYPPLSVVARVAS